MSEEAKTKTEEVRDENDFVIGWKNKITYRPAEEIKAEYAAAAAFLLEATPKDFEKVANLVKAGGLTERDIAGAREHYCSVCGRERLTSTWCTECAVCIEFLGVPSDRCSLCNKPFQRDVTTYYYQGYTSNGVKAITCECCKSQMAEIVATFIHRPPG